MNQSSKKSHAATLPTSAAANQKKSSPFTPQALLKIPEEYKKQIRSAFDMFDTEGVGRIRASEVKVALYALGYDVSNADLVALLKNVGVNPNEDIDYNDFYNALFFKMTSPESRTESVRAFKAIDEDGKDRIVLDDLRKIADSLGMDLTDDELTELLLFAHPTSGNALTAEFDANEMLEVHEEDFLKLMKRANVY
ncbi:centrin-2 [Angomonas deanei]|nr:centrin-2 [Angomonas deanei]|eukprot:EPY42832.1 centrin-2 [Angomonas deanei]